MGAEIISPHDRAVGVPRIQKVYPLEVRVLPPPRIFRGRRPTHPVVTEDRLSVETALNALPDEAWLEVRKAHGHQGRTAGEVRSVAVARGGWTDSFPSRSSARR